MAKKIVERRFENGVLYTDGSLRIDNVRASYFHWAEPFKSKDAKPDEKAKYSGTFIMPDRTHREARAELLKAAQKLIDSKHAAKPGDGWDLIPAANKFCRVGEGKKEYLGSWVLKASESLQPKVRNIVGNNAKPDEVYSGCWGSVLINPWAQDNKFGKKINANLLSFKRLPPPAGFTDEPFGRDHISDDDVDDVYDDVGTSSGFGGGASMSAPSADDLEGM